jgi:hypothetical protein
MTDRIVLATVGLIIGVMVLIAWKVTRMILEETEGEKDDIREHYRQQG